MYIKRGFSRHETVKMVVIVRRKLTKPAKEQQKLCWVIGVLSLVGLSLAGVSVALYQTPRRLLPCELVEGLCSKVLPASPKLPQDTPVRAYTDEEVAAYAVASAVLAPKNAGVPKIAFLFLTAGPLPFEFVWEGFFKGHEGKYSVYIHASEMDNLKIVYKSKAFIGRDIPSGKVYWGEIGMIDAERRLLARALVDKNNQFFVLLSDSCIPLHGFDYIYRSLMNSTISFVDAFDDPGPHGIGRFRQEMMPEVQRTHWRKGAQSIIEFFTVQGDIVLDWTWFAVMRKHAFLLVADHLFYRKFRDFCKRGPENGNCYPDEHYVQTFLHIMDPSGLSNWTVTHVDWSDGGWHPRSYSSEDVTEETLRSIQIIDEHVHQSSDGHAVKTTVPCMWGGEHRPCFLFARKFLPETAGVLAKMLPSMIATKNKTEA